MKIHSIQTKQLQENHFISKRNKALFFLFLLPNRVINSRLLFPKKQRHTFHRKVVNEDLS